MTTDGRWLAVDDRWEWVPAVQPPSPDGLPGQWRILDPNEPSARWEWHPAVGTSPRAQVARPFAPASTSRRRDSLVRPLHRVFAFAIAAVIVAGVALSVSGRAGTDDEPAKLVSTRDVSGGSQPLTVPTGRQLQYAPNLDGAADPGEVVWAWVPYEEEANQGKDRPLLVVGRDGADLLGLELTSNSDREGQLHWLALGSGTWDAQRRPSWIRLERVLVVAEHGIRREGAILDRGRFDVVAGELRRSYGWS